MSSSPKRSASVSGGPQFRSPRPISVSINPRLVQDLKNRLYDKGINAIPLPSVKRPRLHNIPLKGGPKEPVRAESMDRAEVSPLLEQQKPRELQSRPSITGFVNSGALRPSSARRRIGDARVVTSRGSGSAQRPVTAGVRSSRLKPATPDTSIIRSGITSRNVPSRPFSSNTVIRRGISPLPTREADKSLHLLEPLSDLSPIPQPSKALEVSQSAAEDWSDLDKFIQLIEENQTDPAEFVYLTPGTAGDPYDLAVVSANELKHEKYLTLSAKGISTFVNGSPYEFVPLADWLVEREAYYQLKDIAFFNRFRLWKVCTMWKRNVNHVRREKKKQQLIEKLYHVDPNYAPLLLTHRSLCCEIEKYKFVDIPGHMEGLSLATLLEHQRNRREEVGRKLEDYAAKLWDNVNVNVGIIMDKLREGIVSSIALDEQHRRISSSQPVFPTRRRTNTALYDKLGFPENMNFGHRALLRNQCSRYLRFSYLADFYVLESLRNVYISSVRELVTRLKDLTGLGSEVEGKAKRSKQPLLLITLQFARQAIPDSHYEVVTVQPYLEGISKPLEFDVNHHLELLEEDTEGDSPMKQQKEAVSAEVKMTKIVPMLHTIWLHMSPERNEVYTSLMEVISEGLDSLMAIERWSRHPKLSEFASALDEWDDKVADTWDPPDNLCLDPKLWLLEEPEYSEVNSILSAIISEAFSRVDTVVEQFQGYLHHYWKNKEVDFGVIQNARLKGQVEAFTNVCALFQAQKELFDTIPKVSNTGLLKLDSSAVRTKLVKLPAKLLTKVHTILPMLLRERCDQTKDWTNTAYRALSGRVTTVREFVTQKNALEKTNALMQDVRQQLDTYGALYALCTKLEIPVKKEDKENYQDTINLYNSLTSSIILVESNMEKNISTFKKEIASMIPDLLEDVKSLDIKISDEKYFRLETQTIQAISELDDYSVKCAEFEERASNINEYQVVLGLDLFRFEVVDDLREQINLRNRLWKSLKEWRELQKKWISSPFSQIDVRFISDKADEFAKVVTRAENGLTDNPVTRELKDLVFKFRETMPVVIAMRSPLEPSHWAMIKEIIGQDFEINDEFTLGHLMAMNVIDKQEQIQAIQVQAAQEASLKAQLSSVKSVWEDMEIEIQTYKDHKELYILGDIEEMLGALDESCATLSTIAGNRYVAVIRDEVNKWKEWLNTMQDIMEEWIVFQKNWMYLENIFMSSDIKRQLMTESQTFEQADKFYKNLMKKISGSPNALKNTGQNPELLHHLRRYNQSLDEVLKQLSKYLSGKRKLFPRFYFLSDDELLHILAQAQDPHQIQPHLKKCFDNIYRLEFSTEKTNEVLAMESSEKELVRFEKPVRAKGNVEEWLNNVQVAMYDALKAHMKLGRAEYDAGSRKEWVLKHPGQVIATIAQVMWTYESEEAIKGQIEVQTSLEDWFQANLAQLDQLTELVRGALTDLERRIIVALITTDVHNRDIVSDLKKNEVANSNDFIWQQQLRYYWDFEGDVVIARQVTAQLFYGYEYMGATSRLVITPLTDRCWITITSALHIKLGAAPAGPAGTGKTESTKDLAKALGIQCVVFNCSEQITYKMIGRLFSGLAQQGAWSCLDEFNRIDIEVLSVIAQQLLTIRRALLQNAPEFRFEDDLILLKPTCGVFVTMNPGYAGRTELPDNLKVCFRPVSMMIPDYALIAEIMLFAEGFSNAKALSKKMVQLYKLSSEQLSRQDHYDFGMRAVKSVLVMAGELKRSEPTISEEAVLIRAMIDSNVPKFVIEDLPLFNALVQDLFPGVEIKTVDYGKFQTQVNASLVTLGYQKVPEFGIKVIQLFDTFNVRFGVMIVGPTGSGKTTCYRTLQHAMTEMRVTHNFPDRRFQKVDVMRLNPKCVSMGELYGEVNPLTQDWRDGLASSLMRKAAEDTTDEKKWVVFDGPVDALWIENMNTVLDDNMMLCLANGERVKLRPQMRILFEVQDLAVASPATVSRCGMVYISPQIIGWKPYLKSWLPREYPDTEILTEEMKAQLMELFEMSVETSLKMKKTALAEAIATVPIQMVRNVCNFLEVLLDPASGYKASDSIEKRQKYLTHCFVFAYIWGMGGALRTSAQEKVSKYAVFRRSPSPFLQTSLHPHLRNRLRVLHRLPQARAQLQALE